MASPRTIARIEALVWILIYGGLLTLVLGLAVRADAPVLACVLMTAGLVVAAAGAVLIWVRSRLKPD